MEQASTKLSNNKHISRLIRHRNLLDFAYITAGVLMAGLGLKGFLLPNHFLDGGAMGVSLLLQNLSGIDLSILIIAVNLPFILLGARQISVEFAIKSTLAIFALALFVHYLQFPPITSDRLLIAVFGGFFLGAGIGFSIRGGAVIDGTEVLAISVSRKSSLTVGDFITIFNFFLFLIAAVVLNLETAMYSMLTYFSASKTVDFIINGVEEYIGVTIVSTHADAIQHIIAENLGRGVTVYKSEGGIGKSGVVKTEGKILFCAVTRLEVTKLILEIEKIDPQAFVVQHPLRDTKGGMIKKRPLH
jgi:uncharacterized membrane-anchored protein YitT (DUF2179 family)